MSRTKSQFKSKLNVRTATSTTRSVPLHTGTSSIISTRTRNSFQTAFFNFMRDFKQQHLNKNYLYVMRLGGRRWHSMTQADRAPYVLEAARNRRIARPRTKMPAKNKKKKDQTENKQEDKRCPACGHRKSSRKRNRSRTASHSRSRSRSRSRSPTHSSKSSNSNESNHSN